MEVYLQQQLNHKNIIKLVDYFECAQSVILVLERPELHIDLFDFISNQEYLPEKVARKIFRQILEATVHCEEMGVFHRDIKDENVILDLKAGEVKLTDFGSGTTLNDSAYTEYIGKKFSANCFRSRISSFRFRIPSFAFLILISGFLALHSRFLALHSGFLALESQL